MKYNQNSRDKIYDDRYEYEDSYSQADDAVDSDTYDSYVKDDGYEYSEFNPHKKKSGNFFKKIFKMLLCIIVGIVLLGFALSFLLPQKTSFLIMATDKEGTRTDTLMLAVFDKKMKDISLVSIPRDTYIEVDDDTFSKMNEEYPEPSSKSMKINAVHHFGGEKYGTEMIVKQVENIIDTDIDFYAKINIEAFKYIVDSVGGIDFYVPMDMEYYDPYQDLNISLKEGQQHLNGDQAEQVVRFRSGYSNADLGRVDVQQQFVKAFLSQVISPKTIISSPATFLNVLFKYDYIKTNINILNVISYAFLINGINTENIETDTLPGYATYEHGQSVYKLNPDDTSELLSHIYER